MIRIIYTVRYISTSQSCREHTVCSLLVHTHLVLQLALPVLKEEEEAKKISQQTTAPFGWADRLKNTVD
jgi:hypothetical protein